ncbi:MULTISPECIES: LysR substrate-binding domain-containing protein [Curtobacterium]|uniref:LysR substrate-binding domain-containing protein n=1 Tax=Curtobacterium TaxID=2034 RepID=UPI0018E4F523|nr:MULTISPECIES: LysR substrate-binding domain-containing protein [Curtobacterium]MCA5923960.1 LysR family transcriptional regulator [Curtobacterium oceanosedimentum]QQD77285.1 LysR family transcriptional regulator [Curtobacterium sp. YC1]
MLDVRRLVLLRELSIRGTIAAVAEAMNFTPSAVSQQLSALEREAGVQLLRRAGRRLQLTPQAEVLVAAAGQVLDVLEHAQSQVAETLPSVQGRVRVAVFQSAALALMPSALHEMATQHPDVRIEMVQREPETALNETWARDFDMVIAEQYPAHAAPHLSGLDRSDLTTDAVRLALPPLETALLPVSSLDDAAAMPWVMEPRGTASRHFAEQVCRRWGFEPDVRYETADLQTQIRLVESGNAVSLMPDLMWTGRTTTCRLLDLPERPRRTIFTVVRAAGSSSPAVRALRDALERAAAAVGD